MDLLLLRTENYQDVFKGKVIRRIRPKTMWEVFRQWTLIDRSGQT